jgi:hypothetical protein
VGCSRYTQTHECHERRNIDLDCFGTSMAGGSMALQQEIPNQTKMNQSTYFSFFLIRISPYLVQNTTSNGKTPRISPYLVHSSQSGTNGSDRSSEARKITFLDYLIVA